MDLDDPLHLQNKNINAKVTSEGRISGWFCSDTVNLSHRVLTETEIKVLEKGLDYAPIQKKINKPELRKDFSEFCQCMRNKWYFRNEPTPQFSEVPCFKNKSNLFDISKKQRTLTLTLRNGRPCVLQQMIKILL